MFRLKLRLMRENLILYLVMIGMSIVFTGIFSGSTGGDYLPSVAIVDSSLTENLSLHTEGYRFNHVTYDEGVELLKNRDVIALVYTLEDESVGMMHLSEQLESIEFKMALEEAIKTQEAAENVSVFLKTIESEISDVAVNKEFWSQWANKKPFKVIQTAIGENTLENYDSALHSTVGMTLFFLTYSVMFTIGDYLEDKRKKTLNRMRVAPINNLAIQLANLMPGMLIGIVQIFFMVVVGAFLFGVSWGNALPIIILIGSIYVFAASALSFLIVNLVENMSQLGVISPIVLTGMAMIGGCMWPLEIVGSKPLIALSNFTPHKWAISAMEQAVTTGTLTADGQIAIGVLLIMGFTMIFVGQGVLFFKSYHVNS